MQRRLEQMSRLLGVMIPCGVFVGLAATMIALVQFSTGALMTRSPMFQPPAQHQ